MKAKDNMSARSLLFLLACLIFLSPSLSAEPLQPGPRDRCPVCGMFVSPYPNWLAQIEFKDGSREFFDGPKDMFRYYFKLPDTTPVHSKKDIAAIYVTEYYSTKSFQADTLFFVIGSDVHGPMGHELIPVHGRKAAEIFAKDHKGSAPLPFAQITIDMLPTSE